MEKLMEMARRASDQAEIYSVDEVADGISFENGKLKDIESISQSGLSLRIIKDGKLGFAYTKNLLNRQELLSNAIHSLRGGVEAFFNLPLTRESVLLDTFNSALESVSNASIVEECSRVCEILSQKTDGQINVSAGRRISRIRLINSLGTDLTSASSVYYLNAGILFPASYSSIHRPLIRKGFEKSPDSHLDFISDLYRLSSKEVHPQGGRMKVLFLPETMYTLMWRVQGATNGKNLYQKVSPLLGKTGEIIFSKKLTLIDDPLNDGLPDARAFDDEGTPCQAFVVIDHGALANFYYDLNYAKKLNVPPTGHGYKASQWGGEIVSFKPSPSLEHLSIKIGDKSLKDLIRSMDRGIIVAGVMGAHSGNILNGDFSVGLSPGLYVEQGEILGHVKDAMVAGNIFETLKEVVEIEDALHLASGGAYPAVLFDGVSVATKS